ncbi:hypothetical protein FNV43_RR10556 [Rhamnella rubrinervis]|uniref:Uncharacterized protein n=1 Tax=Rhamnella rubrinervis TaxID=2594499 RepID=A0A8K0H4K4_9ROSA|nr:hypothetical protein FNV43_RR10556 [Rhamnella rubrinervis]
MARHLYATVPLSSRITTFSTFPPSLPPISFSKSKTHHPQFMTNAATTKTTTLCESNTTIARRSGDYKPAIWNFDYVQSLSSDYVGESCSGRLNKVKEDVRVKLDDVEGDPLAQLELIDLLQKLGLSHHYEDQIDIILKSMFTNFTNSSNNQSSWNTNNLYATALQFRLLRQHGYWISQEVFNAFKEETGNFKESLCGDTEGILSLYQASYYLIDGETILEEARDFATKHLREYMQRPRNIDDDDDDDHILSALVRHALELPLHWRVPRFEARWFIELYQRKQEMNPTVLEFAKLDFNKLQSIYQQDIKYAFRWWRDSQLGEKLSYARDRMMVSFLWTVGVTFEPELGYCRRMSAIANALITVVDDTYDVYGSLEELEVFTHAVERWDVNAIDHLPDYMKLCFLSLHSAINEIAYNVFKEQGIHILKYLKNEWVGLCRAYFKEARWYYSGYKPSMEEYIENACLSIAAPVILGHAYATATNPITKEDLQTMDEYPKIVHWSGMVLRLADDLGTSTYEIQRGDVPKSIQCYMNKTGASEADAREHIKLLIDETWKKLNKFKKENSGFSKIFIERAMHLGRTAQYVYLYGDGHAFQSKSNMEDYGKQNFMTHLKYLFGESFLKETNWTKEDEDVCSANTPWRTGITSFGNAPSSRLSPKAVNGEFARIPTSHKH